MTAAIAAFASSEAGQTFAAVQTRYGHDPAAGMQDDFLAFNLRAALMWAARPEDEPEPEEEEFRAWVEAQT